MAPQPGVRLQFTRDYSLEGGIGFLAVGTRIGDSFFGRGTLGTCVGRARKGFKDATAFSQGIKPLLADFVKRPPTDLEVFSAYEKLQIPVLGYTWNPFTGTCYTIVGLVNTKARKSGLDPAVRFCLSTRSGITLNDFPW